MARPGKEDDPPSQTNSLRVINLTGDDDEDILVTPKPPSEIGALYRHESARDVSGIGRIPADDASRRAYAGDAKALPARNGRISAVVGEDSEIGEGEMELDVITSGKIDAGGPILRLRKGESEI